MRIILVALCLIVCVQSSFANEDTPTAAHHPRAFSVRVTEFEFKSPAGDQVNNAEILKHLADPENRQKVVEIQTLRLSAIDGQDATAKFGRRVTVTTGKTTSDRGVTRHTQFLDIGTMIQLSGIVKENTCSIAISYEASRLDGEGTDDSPPDVVNSRLTGTYVADLGKPILLGGTNEGMTTFLVLTVER